MRRRMDRHFEHFEIVQQPRLQGRKTHIYSVEKHDGTKLGYIDWYGPWRQYCFYPAGQTLWSLGCLDDIATFLTDLKDERKKTRKKRCAYAMGGQCAHALSEHHGKKTKGDPKKKPCKDCDRLVEEFAPSTKEITSRMQRSLRALDREASNLAEQVGGEIQDEDEDEVRPFIPSFDDEED
jgi:hypothetical protein